MLSLTPSTESASVSQRGRKRSALNDLTGQRFGRWVVLGFDAYRPRACWFCRCDCGLEKSVLGRDLVRGWSKQCCACGHKREMKTALDLTGCTFGCWLVLKYAGIREYSSATRNTDAKHHMHLCRCSCGVEREVIEDSLIGLRSQSCGHFNNTSGLSSWENERRRNHRSYVIRQVYEKKRTQYRRARKFGLDGHFTIEEFEALKKQYGNRCLCCGRSESELISVGLMLVPDHVKALTDGGTDDIENIQPLCHCYREGTFGGCNNSKGATFVDYRPSNQNISPKTSADAAAVTDPLTVN